MKTLCCEIKVGMPVKETRTGRVGILRDIKIVPNSTKMDLCAIFYVEMLNKDAVRPTLISTTSNHFELVGDYEYPEFYPSVHFNHLND